MIPVAERRRPRLLVLASTYPRWPKDHEPGFVHELCRNLTERFEVMALVPDAAGAEPSGVLEGVEVRRYRYAPKRWQTLVHDGGMLANLKRSRWKWLLLPGFFLGLIIELVRIHRHWRPDLIHAHWLLPQGAVVAGLRRLGLRLPPFVVTSHGADLFALRGRVFEAIKRAVMDEAAAVTVVSAAMRDEVVRLGCHPSKASVQPMGVDIEGRFKPDSSQAWQPGVLLFVGRLVEKKGLRHLIDAMPLILVQRRDARLLVAGFGPEKEDRRRQATELGLGDRVQFLGPQLQESLPSLYREAAVMVAPFVRSESGDEDGLGLVVIEAMACGARLVIGDIAAAKSTFDGVPGVALVDAGDRAALAAACIEALGAHAVDPTQRGGFLRGFGWPARARAYADLFEAHLNGARGNVPP